MAISLPATFNTIGTATVADDAQLAVTGITSYNWVEFSVVWSAAGTDASGWFRVTFDGTAPQTALTTADTDALTFFVDVAAVGDVLSFGPYLLKASTTTFNLDNTTGGTMQLALNTGKVNHDYRTAIGGS